MSDKGEDHSKMLSNRLGLAIHNGELEDVRMYIDQGADVNRQCDSALCREWREMCPLALACSRGHEEIMEELLRAGAHPDHVPGWPPWSALFIAAEERVLTLSMLRCLISHGADVDFRNVSGESILHCLARCQFSGTRDDLLSAAKLLLDNGASVDAIGERDYTPLYEAWIKSGMCDLVKLFIAEGADVNFDIGDITMLRSAADGGNIDMFDMLLNAGANKQLTPIALTKPCIQNDHAMIARILETCDMDINMRLDQFKCMTILHYACDDRGITSETVRLLLDRGADVRAVSDTGDTALHYAAMKCDRNKICQLLAYTPPLNIKNSVNQTPLLKLTCELNSSLVKVIQSLRLTNRYTQPRQQTQGKCYQVALPNASLLAFKMLVTAGAKVTADVEHDVNQFCVKHPEAQLPDYKIRSTRSLKELCRFVIRGTILAPVDVSLCKLPIPKPLQEYLNFPEFDSLVDDYLNIIATDDDDGDDDGDDYIFSNAFDPFEGENDDDDDF